MPVSSARLTFSPASNRISTQSKPFSTGERRRDHVAPVRNRGRAEHDHKLRAETEQFAHRSLERRLIVRHAAFGHDGGPGRGQPLGRNFQGFVHHLRREPRQHGRNHTDALDDIRGDAQRAAFCRLDRGIAQPCLDAERNKLDGCDHLALDHRFESRERSEGNGFIDGVDAIDRGAIDHEHARSGRKQIGPAGKGTLDINAVAGNGPCDAGGGDVLRYITLLQPHDDDFLYAGAGQSGNFRGTDSRALLQHQRTLAQRMDGNATDCVRRTGRTELHAPTSSFPSRNCAVISAMIATAISDGETAPIDRPIGA